MIPITIFADIDINVDNYNPGSVNNASKLVDVGNLIIGAIQAFGSVIAVAAFLIIGIRYMLASVEEKAIYKETMTPYLVGAFFLLCTSNIVAMIYNMAKKF